MKWTVKTRLLAGCGLLVVVLAAVCIIGWRQAASSESRIGAVIKDNQADTAKLERVEEAVQDLLHARRAEKEFLLRKDLAFAQIVTNKIAAVKERFLMLSAQPDATSDRTALTNALASVDAFHSAFANLSDLLIRRGLTQDEGLEGELRKAVHAVESTVTNQGIAELDVILLKCRRHEKDYLLRGNTNYLSDIAKRIDEFLTQMTLFSLPEASKTNVMARWKDYYGKMREIMDTDQRVLAASADCQRDSDALQKNADAVRSATVAAITEEQKRALSVLSSGKFLMLVLLFVGVVLGAVVAALLTRSITRPVNAAVSVLQSATEQTAAAAAQISAASQTLAEGASEQAASLEETSASLEEMSSMTRRNAENAQQANTLASQTRTAADTGAHDMAEMTRAMQDIKSSSDDIAKIIKTIDEIAFQTNILALNAAVEAARAGEAGMGFAVVADEVRNLAQRSAQAAKETAAKIEGAIAKTSHGVTISSKVAANLTEIVDKARQVDTLAAEVATASREQSQGIAQVNTAVSQMDKVTQTNAASAEESASAAEELNGQAAALKHAVDDLLRLVGQEAHEASGSSPAAATTPRQVAANRLPSHSKSARPAVSAPPAAAGKASSNGVARTGTPSADAAFKDF